MQVMIETFASLHFAQFCFTSCRSYLKLELADVSKDQTPPPKNTEPMSRCLCRTQVGVHQPLEEDEQSDHWPLRSTLLSQNLVRLLYTISSNSHVRLNQSKVCSFTSLHWWPRVFSVSLTINETFKS